MTMVQHRSELSMSRTGIHGGLRRGTAAAAVGAVLVLSTGVPASFADDATSPPRDPAAQASGRPQPAPRASLSVPAPLLPAVKASLAAGTTTGQATVAASEPSLATTTLPLPDLPLPAPSGTTLAPSTPTPAAASSPASAAPAAPAPATASAPPHAAQAVPPAPAAAVQSPGGMVAGSAAPAPGAGTQAGTATAGAPDEGNEADMAAGAAPAAPVVPGTAGSTVPTAFARQPHPAGTPQAAGVPADGHRPVSSTGPIAGLPDAMVWLGVGLVGIGTAAGLVFFRLRRPW
ncbi:hypothetical protein [Arthrobacter sp. MAHUQ-56]